jgi:urea carboxylase system permease
MANETGDVNQESTQLATQFGYKQRLNRTLGQFASFAFAFAYTSELSGITLTLGLGIALGGPAFMWSWPIVVVGMAMVGLVFAELAATYPVAGSVYNWSKKVSSPRSSWLTGWLMVLATIITIASVVPAYAILLPQISSVFQIVGDGTGTHDFSENAVVLGTIAIAVSVVLNAWGVKIVALVNNWVVRLELLTLAVVIFVFLINATHSPAVLFHTQDTGTSHSWGYTGAFLAAAVASAYNLYGFDTASSLAEETKDPRRAAPKAIMQAIAAAGISAALLMVTAVLAVNDPADPGFSLGGLVVVIKQVFGSVGGDIVLASVVLALTSALLAVHAFAVRMIFAMARDNNLPGGAWLSRVSHQTPIIPTVVTAVLAEIMLLINIKQTQIIAVIVSVAIVLVYLAYLGVIIPVLRARLRGEWPPPSPDRERYFSLGRWGVPVTIAATAYLGLMAFNLAWPRKEIFNAVAPFHWYLQYGAWLLIGLAVGVGLIWYQLYQRHQTQVIGEHRADSSAPAVLAPPQAAGEAEV